VVSGASHEELSAAVAGFHVRLGGRSNAVRLAHHSPSESLRAAPNLFLGGLLFHAEDVSTGSHLGIVTSIPGGPGMPLPRLLYVD
jgi:hypothetical protein